MLKCLSNTLRLIAHIFCIINSNYQEMCFMIICYDYAIISMIVLVCIIAISVVTNYIHETNASQTTNHINEITSAFIERYFSFNYTSALYYDAN